MIPIQQDYFILINMGLLYRRGRRRRQWKPGIDWGIGLSNKRLDPHIYIALLFLSILQVHLCVTATAHAVQQSDNIEHHHLRSRAVESESSWTCNAFYQSLVTGEPYVQPISNDLTCESPVLLKLQSPECWLRTDPCTPNSTSEAFAQARTRTYQY